jgi:protein tyrosine phosphatase (PTP) superfamily phosphohydrolase (DUF442 family)
MNRLKHRGRFGSACHGPAARNAPEQDLRSLRLQQLEPIIRARPDAQWFSLQYTPDAAREVCELEEKTGVRIAHYPAGSSATTTTALLRSSARSIS